MLIALLPLAVGPTREITASLEFKTIDHAKIIYLNLECLTEPMLGDHDCIDRLAQFVPFGEAVHPSQSM
jgi:hypothetical protein